MESKIIKILSDGRAYSPKELSQRLRIDIPTVISALETLEREGRLRKINAGCVFGGSCRGCAAGCYDMGISPPAMWEMKNIDE